MKGDVYAKTDKGREEIATRGDRLPARLRSLLLMIDGQRAVDSLPGATDDNMATLLQGDYIVLQAKAAVVQVPAPAPAPKTASAPTLKASPTPAQVNLHDIYSSRFRRTE